MGFSDCFVPETINSAYREAGVSGYYMRTGSRFQIIYVSRASEYITEKQYHYFLCLLKIKSTVNWVSYNGIWFSVFCRIGHFMRYPSETWFFLQLLPAICL